MNTDTIDPPIPYVCAASKTLAAIVAAADDKAKTAESISARRQKARGALADAERSFLNSLGDAEAALLTAAKHRLVNLDLQVGAIEDAGGVESVRYRGIHRAETFAVLADGFAARIEALNKLLPQATKALAHTRASATESGQHSVVIEFTADVQRLRLIVEAIVTHKNEATALREWCQRWTPTLRMDKTYADVAGNLEAPLPA